MGIKKCQLFSKELPAMPNFPDGYGKNRKVKRKGNKYMAKP